MYPGKSINITSEYGNHKPPYEIAEKERGSPKLIVWCGLVHNKIIIPFIFVEFTMRADIYLDTLKHYVIPQLEEFQWWVVFQQNGAPPHWSLMICDFLNETFPNRWIGRSGPTPWRPRSPDITPLDFFVGLCKRQSVQNTST